MGKPCNMKPIKENSVKTRRKFDETFKREAVQNWLSSGKSAEVIAQELGLHADRLYAWKKRFAPAAAGGDVQIGTKQADGMIGFHRVDPFIAFVEGSERMPNVFFKMSRC